MNSMTRYIAFASVTSFIVGWFLLVFSQTEVAVAKSSFRVIIDALNENNTYFQFPVDWEKYATYEDCKASGQAFVYLFAETEFFDRLYGGNFRIDFFCEEL
jgi:hypothetical protein